MMTTRFAISLLALTAVASPAFATGEILSIMTDRDKDRLGRFEQVKTDAVQKARREGQPGDVRVLERAVGATHRSFQGLDLTGNWQCRTIKAGGPSPLVVYGWFRCRISDDGSGWRLQKITGSQRTVGRFFDDGDKRMTYLGSFFVSGEEPQPYGTGEKVDQAGYVFRTGRAEWQIEFPQPYYESTYDILQFRR